uniref:Serum response factor-binding protein 1 n=1 Tax=Mola mola TaxID=94237 RepID=A0A3Q3XR57_MOLML
MTGPNNLPSVLDPDLNLNNEVVKMRKEVKRVKVLIIRKLTRQIAALKKKKGNETEVERNHRRASRVLQEIHALKLLSPDLVTKTALQKNLNFEQECDNPKSTFSDRATARIGTHPQFKKKIEDIKAAVKAFKEDEEERRKEEDIVAQEKKIIDNDEGVGMLEDTAGTIITEPKTETGKESHSTATSVCQRKEMSKSKNVKPASAKSSKIKDPVKNKPQSKGADKAPNLKSALEVLQKKKDEEESDLESSDDDDDQKDYFDDSTEERFHKQSSQSEESDEEDDFFVGRVSKFKKKKDQKSTESEKGQEVKIDQRSKVQSNVEEFETIQKSKGDPLRSVFCSSLAESQPGGGSGAARGRGGDKFRGKGKPRGGRGQWRDFNKQSKFQMQEKGTERHSLKYNQSERAFPSGSRGRGRDRGGGTFSHQAPQQALHPSWEASKKRKEQQGQILAFQGKKIKFDDDD